MRKILNKIESKRDSRNIFWKILVKSKDFFYFFPKNIKIIPKKLERILTYNLWLIKWSVAMFLKRKQFFIHPSLFLYPHGEIYLDYAEYKATEGYFLDYLPKRGDVVIDAGAYHGFFTKILSLLVGESGKVIAFEPNNKNFDILQKNLPVNKFKNIIFINKGLYSKNAAIFLGSGLGASFVSNSLDSEKTEASMVKLDDELENIGIKNINFIKMDIEGAEIEAIKGAEQTLRNNNLHLAIASYHILNGEPTHFELEKILNQYGYETKTRFEKHLTTYAWKTK